MDEYDYRILNIQYRECYRFFQKNTDDADICFCNRPKHLHTQTDSNSKSKRWNMKDNTALKSNPKHGTLRNGALYSQLALDTDPATVEKLLLNAWKVPQPRLIMSIIGGAKYFTLDDRLETNFINGIIDVALKSDAWLITNGYNVGIVQLVGQAISKFKFTKPKQELTAIGLCKWGSVRNVEEIIDPWHQKNQMIGSPHEKRNDKEKLRESGTRDLDMNHSHYLMWDDGTVRFYDTKDYRTRLCAHLAKLENETDSSSNIPVVTIVVEGGRDTISNIYYDLKSNIPVVMIEGSGRVADLFKRWLLYTKEFDDLSKYSNEILEISEVEELSTELKHADSPSQGQNDNKYESRTFVQIRLDKSRIVLRKMFNKYEKQLEADLNTVIARDEDAKIAKKTNHTAADTNDGRSEKLQFLMDQVMYCLQPNVRDAIAVFNSSDNRNLSETIFQIICKSRQKLSDRKENDEKEFSQRRLRRDRQETRLEVQETKINECEQKHKHDRNVKRSQLLDLAMDWNCIDVAKELILQNSLHNILNKERAFVKALIDDKSRFVYEFLKMGLNPCEIFFPGNNFFQDRFRYKRFLELLYAPTTINKGTTHLSSFVQTNDPTAEKHFRSIDDLNKVISKIIGDYMHKLYFNNEHDEKEYRKLWGFDRQNNKTKKRSAVTVFTFNDNSIKNEEIEKMQDYVMRDLFLWSVLMNHIEIAKVFLSHLKYRICSALIATKILKQYHKVATYGELKENYMKNAEYFQQYAIECINQCEANDPDQACQLVLQSIDLYGNVSCLQVASDAKDKLFIATSCCVQAMNNIWYDKIHPEQSNKRSISSIVIGFFTLGLLAPFFIKYRTEKKATIKQPLNRSFESYGIDYCDPYPLEHPYYFKNEPLSRYLHRVKNFHQALSIKYYYHCLMYIFFLLLFSYVLLFKFQPPSDKIPSIDWTELLTIFLVTSMLIEEIYYFVCLDNLSFFGKCYYYFTSLFKLMTLAGFVLFYVGLILRFTHVDSAEEFVVAKVIMAIDLEIWWLESLSFIIVSPFLGPYLVAIGKMLKDLVFFMCIIAIVMAGYGTASRSMIYHVHAGDANSTDTEFQFSGGSIFEKIAYPVYYLMYGEFGDELNNLDENAETSWSVATHVLLAIHMLFVNILLTNLLIAIFSKRFDQVYEDAQNIWHTQQYLFTREYFTCSPFFPPISLLYDIYHLCRLLLCVIMRVCFKKPFDDRLNVFKIIARDKQLTVDWYQFEAASTYEYAHAEVKGSKITNAVSFNRSEMHPNGKRDDSNDSSIDGASSANTIKIVQDDLARLTQSLEEIKGQLKSLINNGDRNLK